MKKEFLNFTGASWGEFSNAGGQSRIPNALSNADQSLYDYIYQQMLDMDFSVEETLEYLSPYFGGGNYTTPTNSPDSWVGNTDCDDITFCVASDIDSWEYEHFQETELDGSLPSVGLFGKAIIKLYGCEGLVDVTNSAATPMDFYLVALTSAGHIAGSGFIAGNPQQNFLTQANGANLMLNFTSGNFNYLAPEVQDYLIDVQNFIINNCVAISTSPTNPYADTDYAYEISQVEPVDPTDSSIIITPLSAAQAYVATVGCGNSTANTNSLMDFVFEYYFDNDPIAFNSNSQVSNTYFFDEMLMQVLELCNTFEPVPPFPSPLEEVNPYSNCYGYLEAYEYLLANPQITMQNGEGFVNAVFILLGKPQNPNYGDVPAVEGDVLVDEGEGYSVETYDGGNGGNGYGYYEPQQNCNSFMDGICQGIVLAYSADLPAPDPVEPFYVQQEVANTLASAILSLNQFVLDIANGVIDLAEFGAPADYDPIEIFEIVEELFERVVELEMDCNNLQLVPVVVEQALGQMLEDYLTWAYNNGYFDDYSDLSAEVGNQLTLQDVVCMDEYFHHDSYYFIFELLNYTPSICGGVDGCPECPECPDCGLSENCPDCDCPDPCPQGGGLTGGVISEPTQFVCSDGRPPKMLPDGKLICADNRPPKPVKPKFSSTAPKTRAPRLKNRGKSSFNGIRL